MIKKTPDTRHKTQDAKGFSLTEVLLAVGILAVGMLFIASVFPVSVYFTTVATERTIAPIVADEAFAKSRIYLDGYNLDTLSYNSQAILVGLLPNEFSYPSTPTTEPYTKKYWWSAIFRRINLTDVQVTVFVSRKVGATGRYHVLIGSDPNFDTNRPDAVIVQVSGTTGSYELNITDPNKTFINDGYTIVDDTTGQIYRVLERYRPPNDTIIKLDRAWQGGATGIVWVVPPPVNGGRYPCIGVYQKTMRF
jgi:prepilin-type N-terminal cleavage/methylation domain-containing protein